MNVFTASLSRHAYGTLFVVLAFLLASCSGDAIVDVEPGDEEGERVEVIDEPGDDQNPDDPNANEDIQDPGIASLRLGTPQDPAGNTGPTYTVTNGLIEVDGLVFSSGHGAKGNARFHFFFGFTNRAIYSGGTGDSVNVGLFVYSAEPFDGGVEAGAFEGAALRFSIDGHDVLIASRDGEGNLSSTPILGDGSRTPAYVMHVDDFSWTTPSGRTLYNVIGSTPDLNYLLNHDNLEWEFTVEQGEIYINGALLGTVGGLAQNPFAWFFIYAGPERGGLFVVADEPFDGAGDAGAFEGQQLAFSVNGYDVRLESIAPTLLGDGSRRPAWVLHRPDFIMSTPSGNPDGPTFGVTSSLEQLLSKNGGSSASLAHF